MSTVTFDKIYVTLGDRKKMEHFKDVEVSASGAKMTLVKSFLPGYMANKNGLVGMLFNKLFSSMMKKEDFEFSFKDVKKVEVSTTTAAGRTTHNVMFWNCEPGDASYENIDFTISPDVEQMKKLKKVLKPLFDKVDYKELDPQSF